MNYSVCHNDRGTLAVWWRQRYDMLSGCTILCAVSCVSTSSSCTARMHQFQHQHAMKLCIQSTAAHVALVKLRPCVYEVIRHSTACTVDLISSAHASAYSLTLYAMHDTITTGNSIWWCKGGRLRS
jgi:hypothetical protein